MLKTGLTIVDIMYSDLETALGRTLGEFLPVRLHLVVVERPLFSQPLIALLILRGFGLGLL